MSSIKYQIQDSFEKHVWSRNKQLQQLTLIDPLINFQKEPFIFYDYDYDYDDYDYDYFVHGAWVRLQTSFDWSPSWTTSFQ